MCVCVCVCVCVLMLMLGCVRVFIFVLCVPAQRGVQRLPEGSASETQQRDGRPEQDLCHGVSGALCHVLSVLLGGTGSVEPCVMSSVSCWHHTISQQLESTSKLKVCYNRDIINISYCYNTLQQ